MKAGAIPLYDTAARPVQVRLDWKAYFKAFQEYHGEPVPYNGRQLFPDGWMYAVNDYKGPEWPPPAEAVKLRELQVAYWRIRRGLVAEQARYLRRLLEGLRETQAARSVPLQQVVRYRDPDDGSWVTRREDVDMGGIRGRLEEAEADVADCAERLRELGVQGE